MTLRGIIVGAVFVPAIAAGLIGASASAPPNLALHKPAGASNVRDRSPAHEAQRALDDDPATYWATNDNVTSAWLELDMEHPKTINTLAIEEMPELGERVVAYKVEALVDDQWKLLAEGGSIGARTMKRFPPVFAWKVRLTILEAKAAPAIRTFALYHLPGE